MNKLTFFIIVITALLGTGCTKAVKIDGIYVDFYKIEKVKKQVQKGDQKYLPAYTRLLEKAEMALAEKSPSVTDKKRVPPSGDKHDYLSMGPYWWPDTTKPGGLPYIRRDGEVNPETRGEFVDTDAKNKLFSNVETLGWAYYFSGEKKYAEKALQLLETWFVNPETRMNPNLNFAQGIQGRMDGRGIGIIDWSGINKIISPIQILNAHGILPETTKILLFEWFEEYLDWLLNSEYGRDEDDYFNNHGTWYDVQVVGIQMMLGKIEMAKTRLEQAKTKRIVSQIEPDGSQPLELERTKSLGYSTMNLRGFLHLAFMGEKLGVGLWNFESEDGRSIQKALGFLLPFAQGEKKWEYQQLGDLDDAIESLKTDFLMAAGIAGNPEFITVAQSVKQPQNLLETLLYPLSEE
jgi:hypothetical protein